MTVLHSTRRARAYGACGGRARGEFFCVCGGGEACRRSCCVVDVVDVALSPCFEIRPLLSPDGNQKKAARSSSTPCLGRAYLALTAACNVAMWLLVFGLCALLLLFFALALPTGAGKAAVGGAIE